MNRVVKDVLGYQEAPRLHFVATENISFVTKLKYESVRMPYVKITQPSQNSEGNFAF